MLHISYDKRLATLLGVDRSQLRDVLEHADEFYELLTLYDPAKPEKPRDIVNIKGALRSLQRKFYRRVLLPRLKVSPFSHGGIPGKGVRSNAKVHQDSVFLFKADISNFYPSIKQSRIYRLFHEQMECSPPVASLCTRLCTFNHCLALGLITSPILADQLLRRVDHRISSLCTKAGLSYSRFVDDITISGPFDLKKSGIPKVVREVLVTNGFTINPTKNEFGRQLDGLTITGVRVNRRGNLDVKADYAREVGRQLSDAEFLARGKRFNPNRPYYTRAQIRGRIQFVLWINHGRGTRLLNRYRRIHWSRVEEEAHLQELIIAKKRVVPRGKVPEEVYA